jgi:hypothetical protein
MANEAKVTVGFSLYGGQGDVSPSTYLGWYGTQAAAENAAAIQGVGLYTIVPETQVSVVALPPPAVKPPAGAGVVYGGGKFNWAGDWSFSCTVNYADTAGNSPAGKDIAVSLTGQWGGFLPYAVGEKFDTSPFKTLTVAMKATKAGQKAQIYFEQVGDTPEGVALDMAQYGTFVPGEWVVFNIPLVDFKLTNPLILKFAIQDQTGWAQNVFYVDNLAFV